MSRILWRDRCLSHFIDVWLAVFQVTFTEEELPKGSGDFILGYYSNNTNTIVGVTEPFQVIITLALLSQMHYLLEENFTSAVCYYCWFAHLHLFHYRYWHSAALSSHSASSIPLLSSCSCIFRSSYPLQVLTTALQTALTSAPKMTALLSSWRRGPTVQVHAGANTAAITAAAAATAGRAALNRSKWKHSMSMMVLPPAPLRQLRVSPQDVQQRAAAARSLLLGRKKKRGFRAVMHNWVLLLSQVTYSQLLCLLLNTSTTLYVFCSENIQFLMPFFSGTAVWFVQEAHFALSCSIKLCTLYIFLFLILSLSVQCFFYLCPFSGVNSTGSWHLALGGTQGFVVTQSERVVTWFSETILLFSWQWFETLHCIS